MLLEMFRPGPTVPTQNYGSDKYRHCFIVRLQQECRFILFHEQVSKLCFADAANESVHLSVIMYTNDIQIHNIVNFLYMLLGMNHPAIASVLLRTNKFCHSVWNNKNKKK